MKINIKSNIFANSTSKQKWSFSKSRRFIDLKTPDVTFYNTPSSLDKRSVSFGVGKRPDIANTISVTDPTKYNISSSFDNNKRGFSFGTGRDQTKFQNYLKTIANTSTIYKIDDSFLHKGKAFSIKQRTAYPPNCNFLPNDPETQRRSKLPGPSTYETIDNLGQKCVTSNKKSIGYRFPHSQRFNRSKTYEVGPGSYDDKTITADGDYILSNMKSSGRRTIFKGKRTNILVKNQTIPGPGEYDILGDFGAVTIKNTLNSSTVKEQKTRRPQTARH